MASHEITYTLRDRLGSVVTLSNHNNLILEHRSYDPFGKPRYGTMQVSPSATLWNIAGCTPFTMRGFTDHEHIDEAQLIHMNGRVYDYNLGRFLSVDPFIQEPGNSQSLNPYSYIMNNPLAGTDPSGYLKVCDTFVICSHKQATDSEYNKLIILSSSVALSNGKGADSATARTVAKNPEETGAPGEGGSNPSEEGGSGTNSDQVVITGSLTVDGQIDLENVEIELHVSDRNIEGGYATADDAVIAQFRSHVEEYEVTVKNETELTGMVFNQEGKYYFSNMIEVPQKFNATITLIGFRMKQVEGLVHTHSNNSTFTGIDYVSPAAFGIPAYVRNKRGNVYKWTYEGASKYQRRVDGLKRSGSRSVYEEGIKNPSRYGISDLCPGGNLCQK